MGSFDAIVSLCKQRGLSFSRRKSMGASEAFGIMGPWASS
jgi:hypothetical protein